jgi:hypothetical protein
MTMAVDISRLQWETVATGIWIGRQDGRFAGVIEGRPGTGFVANTPTGELTCATLAEAKASFEPR